MGISDWLIDEVRTKLDTANKDDIGLLIGATRAVNRSRQGWDKCGLVSTMIKNDNTRLIEMRADLKKVNRKLDEIQLSDSFMIADEMAQKAKEESKWNVRIDNLNSEVEIKTGRSIEALKKQYRISEENFADKK